MVKAASTIPDIDDPFPKTDLKLLSGEILHSTEITGD
jgi:hypothetical protein